MKEHLIRAGASGAISGISMAVAELGVNLSGDKDSVTKFYLENSPTSQAAIGLVVFILTYVILTKFPQRNS